MEKLIITATLIGLLWASFAWAEEGLQIRLKDVPAQEVLCLKTKTSLGKLSEELGKMYGQLYSYIGSQQIKPAGPPLAVYYSYAQNETEFEACVPVPAGTKAEGEIKAQQLPGGQMVSAMHLGSYSKFAETYKAIEKWMAENGYQPAGPCREVYLVSQHDTKNEAELKTEILWPVQKK